MDRLAVRGREGAVEDLDVLVLEVRRALDCFLLVEVLDDVLDLGRVVAHAAQHAGDRLVDDLHHPAAHELLVLDEGDVGLDAGGVAVHHEADGAGGRENGDLGVAVSVLGAEGVGLVPHVEGLTHERTRDDRGVDHVRVLAVLLDDAEHGLGVLRVAGESAHRRGHPGTLRVGLAVHEGGDRRGVGAAGVGVVSEAAVHQEDAEVRVAEAERTVVVRVLLDGGRRVAGVVDQDLLGGDHGPAGGAEGRGFEFPVLAHELHEVERGGCRRCRRGTCTRSRGCSR